MSYDLVYDRKCNDCDAEERELLFAMEEIHLQAGDDKTHFKSRQCRPAPYFLTSSSNKPFGINISPGPFIPGAKIENHLGSLNFFFIRESSNVREVSDSSEFSMFH